MNRGETMLAAKLDPAMRSHLPTALIMAGGTGGHVFPGLAVAHELRAHDWNVVWMGAKGGIEADLVPKYGIELAWVRFSGVRGKGLVPKLLLPFNLFIAFWQAFFAIMRIKPRVVLSMGGYIAFPGGMMAALLGKPLIVHEQNSIAGLTNKVLAMLADRKLEAFPGSLKNAQWTGNPVRSEIANLLPPASRFAGRSGPIRLLVVGGSLGAQALNDVLPRALALIPLVERPSVIHQAGAKQLEQLKSGYAALGVQAHCVAFIDGMAQAYADCDLLVCRAGAMTVAEVAAAGVAALFVPFPFAVDDHQTSNAKFLSDQAAALLVQQRELTPDKLAALIGSLSRAQLQAMAERARTQGKADAAQQVARVCMQTASGVKERSV